MKMLFVAFVVIASFFTLSNLAIAESELGNCFCIDAGPPPSLASCHDNLNNADCKAKETDKKACFLAKGQTGKCSENNNDSYTTKYVGDCICEIEGKSDKTISNNHDPMMCAGVQSLNKASNPGKKVVCEIGSIKELAAQEELEKKLADIKTPKLNVPIPGLNFTKALFPSGSQKGSDITIPWLAQYIAAAYQYFVGVAVIAGIIIMMIGGLQWITAGGDSGRVGQARDKIRRAFLGIMIALGSYLILYTINPDTLSFKALQIPTVSRLTYDYPPDNDHNETGAGIGTVQGTKAGKLLTGAYAGETVISRCHIVPVSSFPQFNLNEFGDDGIGRCLLEELTPEIGAKGVKAISVKQIGFLQKKLRVHSSMEKILKQIEVEILQLKSPISKHWISNFVTDGAFVDYIPISETLSACNKPGPETWVVKSDSTESKHRLLTRVLKNLRGNHDNSIRGDMHSLGIAVDYYGAQNPDFVDDSNNIKQPLSTQIPSEIVDIMHKNKFQWLANAGRDAMHFQYIGGKCFTGTTSKKYPTGTGCCNAPWKDSLTTTKANTYEKCMQKGGSEKTFTDCLGPNGVPGAYWVKKSIEPK